MQVKETKAEGLSRTYDITITAAELDAKLDAKVAEMQPEVSLKGFRPGKVPAAHIKRMFGKSMMGELVQTAMDEASQKALNDNEIKPAGNPQYHLETEVDEIVAGKADLKFHMHVDIMPDFTPTDPAKLKIERPVCKVSDAEVDETIARIAGEQKSYKEKAASAKAKDGDAVVIDFSGSVDGEKFEGGSAEDTELVIGSGQFIPGFEEQLIGAKKGDTPSLNITFPKDYQAEHLAGKDAVFETVVKAVKGPVDTVVDDEFATKLGMTSLESLSDAVRKNIETEYTSQSRARAKRRVLDAMDEKHDFDLPPGMVEAEFSQIWQQVEADLKEGNVDDEDKGKSEDDLKKEYRAIAERRVRLGLVLAEIGQQNNVIVAAEEVSRAINQEAMRYQGQEKQVVEYFQNNPEAQARLRAPIFEEKVVDYILELADVKDVKVSKEELFSDDDAPGAAKKAPAKKKAAKKAPAKKAAAKKPAAKKPAVKKKPAAKK
ncbi:MAG: trigger factor [Robiginitomaculum sp.]|nr:MAG: trigger factor [Robiginitomaculum sp.]